MLNSNPPKKFSDYYKIFCVILINAVIIFIIINAFISYYEKRVAQPEKQEPSRGSVPFKFKEYSSELAPVYPGWTPEDANKLIYETRHVTLGYDPFTQFKERPFVGKYVNVDPRGFRPIKNQGPWFPLRPAKNIFVFGGSTTFGYGVADWETIASVLQEVLTANNPKQPINVYNLGRCSYISSQELILIEKLIQSGVVPDVAIFIDGLNDFAHCNGVPGFTKQLTRFMEEGDVPEWRRTLENLPVMRMIQKKSRSSTEDPQNYSEAIVSDVIKRYKTNKKLVESICGEFAIKPLFVWQPTAVYQYDQDYNIFGKFDYDGFLPYVRVGYEAVAQHYKAGEFGDKFLWLADMQENLKEPLYVDAVHYSAKMSKLIADQISIALSEKNILP